MTPWPHGQPPYVSRKELHNFAVDFEAPGCGKQTAVMQVNTCPSDRQDQSKPIWTFRNTVDTSADTSVIIAVTAANAIFNKLV